MNEIENNYSRMLIEIITKNKDELFDEIIKILQLMKLMQNTSIEHIIRNGDALIEVMNTYYINEDVIPIKNWLTRNLTQSNYEEYHLKDILQFLEQLSHEIKVFIEKEREYFEERYYLTIMLNIGIGELRSQFIALHNEILIEELRQCREKYQI